MCKCNNFIEGPWKACRCIHVTYCALPVGCQSALLAILYKTILCGPMWSIFTTQYALSYCVVCSIHILTSLQPDNQPAKHNTACFSTFATNLEHSVCTGTIVLVFLWSSRIMDYCGLGDPLSPVAKGIKQAVRNRCLNVSCPVSRWSLCFIQLPPFCAGI